MNSWLVKSCSLHKLWCGGKDENLLLPRRVVTSGLNDSAPLYGGSRPTGQFKNRITGYHFGSCCLGPSRSSVCNPRCGINQIVLDLFWRTVSLPARDSADDPRRATSAGSTGIRSASLCRRTSNKQR